VTTPAKYREYAAVPTARQLAQVPEVRAALLLTAQRWTEQAERAERAERNAAGLRPLNSD